MIQWLFDGDAFVLLGADGDDDPECNATGVARSLIVSLTI